MHYIKILSVGRKNESYLELAWQHFWQRLQPHVQAELILLPSANLEGQSDQAIAQIKKIEGQALLDKINKLKIQMPASEVILLDEKGKMLTSPQFAQKQQLALDNGTRQFIYLIGGAYGVSEEVKQAADWQWSFSSLVFPHQLMRVMLLEQLYRAVNIQQGSKYHHS